MCVAGAINNYTAQLQTYTDSQRTGCKHSKSLNSFCTNKLLRLAIIVTIKVDRCVSNFYLISTMIDISCGFDISFGGSSFFFL